MSSQEEIDKVYEEAHHYAMKKICAQNNYDYDSNLNGGIGGCIHNQKTCIRDFPYNTDMTQIIDGKEVPVPYAEWIDNKCIHSDASFKYWCVKQGLQYTPDYKGSGVGYCEINKKYCNKYGVDFNQAGEIDAVGEAVRAKRPTKDGKEVPMGDCYRTAGQFLAEELLAGKTLVRGTKELGDEISGWISDERLPPWEYESVHPGWLEVKDRKSRESNLSWLNRITNMIFDQDNVPDKDKVNFEKISDEPEKIREERQVTIDGRVHNIIIVKINEGPDRGKIVDYQVSKREVIMPTVVPKTVGTTQKSLDYESPKGTPQSWDSVVDRNGISHTVWLQKIALAILGGVKDPYPYTISYISNSMLKNYTDASGANKTFRGDKLLAGKNKLYKTDAEIIARHLCSNTALHDEIKSGNLFNCSTGKLINFPQGPLSNTW